MTTLDATAHDSPRLRLPTMAEIQQSVENMRTDVRKLWLPLGTALVLISVVFGGVITATVWVVRTTDKADATTTLATELRNVNSKLDTMQGSVNALMQMQSTVAETKAQVGSLNSRLDNIDVAIQAQNTWILTTRERLARQGFETPEFKPPLNQ